MRLITVVFLLTLTLACHGQEAESAAQAAEPDSGQRELNSEDRTTNSGKEDIYQQQDDQEDELTEAQPDADLRARRLGDAFRNFTPSEEISADNAVSFPVDI